MFMMMYCVDTRTIVYDLIILLVDKNIWCNKKIF